MECTSFRLQSGPPPARILLAMFGIARQLPLLPQRRSGAFPNRHSFRFMFTRFSRRSRQPNRLEGSALQGFRFNALDACVLMGIFVFVFGGALPLAMQHRDESRRLEQEIAEVQRRTRRLDSTLKYLQARRDGYAALRQAARHYDAAIQTRAVAPWTTLIRELSTQRPGGVWTTRISGAGPRFTVEIGAVRPELADAYVGRLRQSQYIDYAAFPPGEGAAARATVIGRVTGD